MKKFLCFFSLLLVIPFFFMASVSAASITDGSFTCTLLSHPYPDPAYASDVKTNYLYYGPNNNTPYSLLTTDENVAVLLVSSTTVYTNGTSVSDGIYVSLVHKSDTSSMLSEYENISSSTVSNPIYLYYFGKDTNGDATGVLTLYSGYPYSKLQSLYFSNRSLSQFTTYGIDTNMPVYLLDTTCTQKTSGQWSDAVNTYSNIIPYSGNLNRTDVTNANNNSYLIRTSPTQNPHLQNQLRYCVATYKFKVKCSDSTKVSYLVTGNSSTDVVDVAENPNDKTKPDIYLKNLSCDGTYTTGTITYGVVVPFSQLTTVYLAVYGDSTSYMVTSTQQFFCYPDFVDKDNNGLDDRTGLPAYSGPDGSQMASGTANGMPDSTLAGNQNPSGDGTDSGITLTSMIQGIASLFTGLYSILPPELMVIIVAAIAALIAVGVLRAVLH